MSSESLLVDKKIIKDTGKFAKEPLWRYVLKNRLLYILLIPGLAYVFIFDYIPIYGVIIAFKDSSIVKGIAIAPGSDSSISAIFLGRSISIAYFETVW